MSFSPPPGYVLVPPAVIAARLERAGRDLAAAGLDALLLTAVTDIFYYSGSAQQGVVLISPGGRARYFVRRSPGRAAAESPLAVTPVKGLTEVAAALGLKPGARLGLCLDLMPAQAYLDWGRRLPGVEMVDASGLVILAKGVKDDFEIAAMAQAGRLAVEIFAAVPGLIRPGVTEAWLAGQLLALAMARGHVDVLRQRGGGFLEHHSWHLASGPEGVAPSCTDAAFGGLGLTPAFPAGASHKPLRPREPIIVDFGVCLNGYQTDQTRTYCLGRAPEAVRRAHHCLQDVQAGILGALRPGAKGGAIYDLAVDTARAHGMEKGFLGTDETRIRFVGHGLGLELGAPPYLLQGSRERVRARQAYALELKIVLAEGPVGLENTVLVQEQGPPIILSPIPDELVEVAV